MTWVTNRIAVGGGIWTDEKMIEVVRAGVTHVIDMQIEFDDTQLAEPYGVKVLWNPTDDDFQLKPPELFQRGRRLCPGGAGRRGVAGVHPLCRRGASRTHDDAGGAAGARIQPRRRDRDDPVAAQRCRFCRCLCRERRRLYPPVSPGEASRIAPSEGGNGAGRAE